jgi:hypothetical protein
MRRLLTIVAISAAATVTLANGAANAQTKSTDRDNKTGRTQEGLKADQEIDQLYRSRAGQRTPEVRSDPWGDVRAPAAPAAQTSTKTKQKQP